jgi:hypothetical protein
MARQRRRSAVPAAASILDARQQLVQPTPKRSSCTMPMPGIAKNGLQRATPHSQSAEHR